MNSGRSWEDLILSFKLLEARARIKTDPAPGFANPLPRTSEVAEKQEQPKPEPGLYNAAWAMLEAAAERDNFEAVKLCQRVIDALLGGRTPHKFDVDVVLNVANS
jgi:hypothetical protein